MSCNKCGGAARLRQPRNWFSVITEKGGGCETNENYWPFRHYDHLVDVQAPKKGQYFNEIMYLLKTMILPKWRLRLRLQRHGREVKVQVLLIHHGLCFKLQPFITSLLAYVYG